jgi:hypothetical protein
MAGARDRRGAAIVHDLFGVNLQEQGRGYYVALEFLAICRGVLDAGDRLLESGSAKVEYERRSHDFARRLAVGAPIDDELLKKAIDGGPTQRTLEALFSSLIVSIPGRRAAPRWYGAHLYPFVGELIHYDAVMRSKNPQVERYVFRDGGGLVYKIVRTDPDGERLRRVQRNVFDLVTDSNTALGRVAAALGSHDEAPRKGPFKDESEEDTKPKSDQSNWPEILRAGVDRITRRTMVPRARRVDQLLHWLPYCVARHQLRLARRRLGHDREHILTDATAQANPIRNRSQRSLVEFRSNIVSALRATAADREKNDGGSDWDKYTRTDARFTASPRAFFSETLAAIGSLNATTGRRHFVLKPPLLEAIVSATVDPGGEIDFEAYCDLLADDLGIIVGPNQARREELIGEVDAGKFATNSRAFRTRLETAGLLTRYSDATDLVHAEVDR